MNEPPRKRSRPSLGATVHPKAEVERPQGRALVVKGRFVHGISNRPGELELVEKGTLIVGEDGRIILFAREGEGPHAAPPNATEIRLRETDICIPGMIDTHVHAPQYTFTGTATDLPLMQWLQKYTFPAERRMADADLAHRVYRALVKKLLVNGTTTAVYYASIHLAATKVLVDVCRGLGQRALVGKVAMDQNGADGYVETTTDSLRDTEALIRYCHDCEPAATDEISRLVNPVVTPRFIPTCSDALLRGLGELAATYRSAGCWVQSHIAESPDEMEFVEALHPGRRDTEIFRAAGLLTDRCIMAHGVHLTPSELRVLSRSRTGIACCPLSNTFFAAGEFPLRFAQEQGLRVGLGTDVAGGYSPSLLVGGCRHAVYASKVLARVQGGSRGGECAGGSPRSTSAQHAEQDEQHPPTPRGEAPTASISPISISPISSSSLTAAATSRPAAASAEVDYKRAFWTATLGGAAALGLDEHLGNFSPGKQFDAVVVQREDGFGSQHGPYDTIEAGDCPLSQLASDFERYINLGDDRNVKEVYVRGRLVVDNSSMLLGVRFADSPLSPRSPTCSEHSD